MIRIGLCGSGFMGTMHAACYGVIPGVKVVAVASRDRASAEKLAAGHGARIYPDALRMIEEADLDVVDVCLPTPLHCEAVVRAARRGLDIFCEKPLARTMAQATRMVKAVQAAGVKCMVGHCLRFWPEYVALKETLDGGKLGKLLTLSLRRVSARPTFGWKNWFNKDELSGGALLDFHIHDVDTVRYLLGEPDGVDSVALLRGGHWDWICTNYRYPGRVVSSEGGWSEADPFEMTFRAVFERGTLLYSSRLEPLTLYAPGKKPRRVRLPSPKVGKVAGVGNISDLGGYYNELKYFTDCLKKGRAPDRASIEEARATLALLFKEWVSARRKLKRS